MTPRKVAFMLFIPFDNFIWKILFTHILCLEARECLKNTTIHGKFSSFNKRFNSHVGDNQQIHFVFEQTAFKFATLIFEKLIIHTQ